ncbi:flagellar hook-basal body protein [Periweissella fabaria]|uniref:Flagellar basal-body rod protein FlgG n=1 Tax=Periweissella fabaria TaxID=546157 RepID=A0ABM8Z6U8_9LACO|nr:flagellar hook-basal body protein [Periweissella fabaria]MCM0597028.1 flagellar hook-basal body protein [Periweissella fabaria]CAH0416983.1 Flagellar basal-body rod protein FlgG [Periweissella fabaria]
MNIQSLLQVNKAGMNGNQNNLDIIANNLANLTTTGFKAKSGAFGATLNNQINNQEVPLAATSNPMTLNTGLIVGSDIDDFRQGGLQTTGQKTDFALQGNGFFGVRDANNQLLLTRVGDFKRDAQGTLVTDTGLHVATTDRIPQNQWPQGEMAVSANGDITIQTPQGSVAVGQLNIYQPRSLNDLQPAGNTMYQAQGGAVQIINGTPGAGSITQGALENANVDMASQMADMISTQRAYQLNAKALQATDNILNVTNNFNQ